MKQKLYRLCNRHRWIPVVATVALMVPLWIDSVLMMDADYTLIPFYVCTAVTIVFSCFLGPCFGNLLMNPTVHHMHNVCDPYPLLQECDDQLSYVKSKASRQLLITNRSAALCELGRTEEALASLETLNIDDPYCVAFWRYVYYNNAASAALDCGQREKAMVYRQKADQAAVSVTNKAQKALIQATNYDWLTTLCLLDGDYHGAATYLSYQTPPENTLTRVHRAYQIAQVEAAFGNLANAKFQLDFVLRYGNRLAVVGKARVLWDEINAQEGQQTEG